MAVVFKTKPVQLIAPDVPLSNSDLAAIGLVQEEKKIGVTIKHSGFSVGQSVRVINDKYPWMDWWKPGDLGVVVRVIPPVDVAPKKNLGRLFEVKLSKVRVSGRSQCLFRAWELEAFNGGAAC